MNVPGLYSAIDQLKCDTSHVSTVHVSKVELQEPSSALCKFCGSEGQDCCSEMDKAEFSADSLQYSRQVGSSQQFSDDSTREEDEEYKNSVNISGEKGTVEQNPGVIQNSDDHDKIDNRAKEKEIKRKQSTSKNDASLQSELSESEKKEVEELKERDREVRAHEQAHLAAAGGLANGGPVYEYEQGPDGRQYAVGGHVSVSIGEGDTPEERLQNAKQAERAALAPAEPSAQDRKVASRARAEAQKAQQEIAEEKAEETESSGKNEFEPKSEGSNLNSPEENDFPLDENSKSQSRDGFEYVISDSEQAEHQDDINGEEGQFNASLLLDDEDEDEDNNTPSSPAGSSPLNRRVSDLYGRNSGRYNPIGGNIYTLA